MLTARAMTRLTTTSEINDWTAIVSLPVGFAGRPRPLGDHHGGQQDDADRRLPVLLAAHRGPGTVFLRRHIRTNSD
jgi:hypothetical protein